MVIPIIRIMSRTVVEPTVAMLFDIELIRAETLVTPIDHNHQIPTHADIYNLVNVGKIQKPSLVHRPTHMGVFAFAPVLANGSNH